jgi:hypothetical protein
VTTPDPRAVEIAAKITTFHAALNTDIRCRILLDWSGAGHWRNTPGGCRHCHSPQPTNLADDHGRYAHKTCRQVSIYRALPADERRRPPIPERPVAAEPVEPHQRRPGYGKPCSRCGKPQLWAPISIERGYCEACRVAQLRRDGLMK